MLQAPIATGSRKLGTFVGDWAKETRARARRRATKRALGTNEPRPSARAIGILSPNHSKTAKVF